MRRIWFGLSFLVVCFLYKTSPNPRKTIFCGDKVAQMPLSTYFSWVGLGWPCIGGFVGFIIIFLCFPTQQKLVNRKHPVVSAVCLLWFSCFVCCGYVLAVVRALHDDILSAWLPPPLLLQLIVYPLPFLQVTTPENKSINSTLSSMRKKVRLTTGS